MIPKIIHYCWFGGKPIPDNLQKCIDTWKEKLPDYKIMRWDESNCSFNENEFVCRAYKEKKYAFISDYYRLKALYEYGGVYLDTDVKVYKSFDDLLEYPAFLGFIFDCAIGTAVIGAEKNSQLIGSLINMYDNTIFAEDDTTGEFIEYKNEKVLSYGFNTNNYYFTYYFINKYPDFLLNNTKQITDDCIILPKEYFEIGSLIGKHYTVHLNDGSWRTKPDQDEAIYGKIKRRIEKYPKVYNIIQILIRRRRYRRLNKSLPFYKNSVVKK